MPIYPLRPRSFPTVASLRAGLMCAVLCAGSALPLAHADLVPTPPPECENKPDGTFCSIANGTAGVCATETDARRPGRSYRVCKRDASECDRLEVGAVCHGYLGKPAHCREFNNPDTKQHWRTCQVDDAAAPAAPSPSAPAAPSATAPAPSATAPAPSTAAQPAAPSPAPAASQPKGLFGCSQTQGSAAGIPGLLAIGLAAAALRLRRRQLSPR